MKSHEQFCPVYQGRECDCNYIEPVASAGNALSERERFDAYCEKEGGSRFTLWDVWQAALASQSTPVVQEPMHASVIKRIWKECRDKDMDYVYFAWKIEERVRASIAAPTAAQGLSDAERLDWLAPEQTTRFIEREKGMFRVYEDVAMAEAMHHKWQACTTNWWPTAQQAIDAAILSANRSAQETK